jgi:hypothetical protein
MTILLLILLLLHPPSGFIYLSFVKEAAPLFTTALRKLTVCSSNPLLKQHLIGIPGYVTYRGETVLIINEVEVFVLT